VPLTPDARLGSYEILSLLGRGGMGEVYRARDTTLGREVAIKMLPPELASDQDRLARLGREAKLLAALNHPHIAAIYSLEQIGDRPVLVMELVPGQTLADRLASGPMPLREMLTIAVQIAKALEAAHAKGIIHRDLKPANIKLTPDHNVKLLDFGLAKPVDEDASAAGDLSASMSMAAIGERTFRSRRRRTTRAPFRRMATRYSSCALRQTRHLISMRCR
jgi:serine/threonine protein kinase